MNNRGGSRTEGTERLEGRNALVFHKSDAVISDSELCCQQIIVEKSRLHQLRPVLANKRRKLVLMPDFNIPLELKCIGITAMQLFHHITVLALSEQEKAALLGMGVEFTRTMKTSRGESVMFEIGENDPRYERLAALLQSLGPKRVRDFSMTVPTLSEYIEKIVRPIAEQRLTQQGYFAKQAKWERGQEVMQETLKLLKAGQKDQALAILDAAIEEAIRENHSGWVSILCHHAAVVAHSMGDFQRQISYEEQALPFAKDYRFAAYNFAQLLLRDGQLVRAEGYATEAYRQSISQTSEADSDLRAAILKQWPNVTQSA